MVRMQALHRAPPQQPTPLVVKPERRPAASLKPGQESCVRSSGIITLSDEGLVMVRDEARLRRGHDDQSHRGNQCSETMLTGESWFHISPPRGFEPGSLVTGSKQVVHWTSETWWECGSPQYTEGFEMRARGTCYMKNAIGRKSRETTPFESIFFIRISDFDIWVWILLQTYLFLILLNELKKLFQGRHFKF